MKKTLLFSLLCPLVLCCKDSQQDASRKEIKLIAPNGQRIAASENSLAVFATNVLLDEGRVESNTTVKLEEVAFYPVKRGYAASITYKTKGGQQGRFLMLNTDLITDRLYFNNPVRSFNSRLKDEDEGGGSVTVISCEGESCCTPSFNVQTMKASCFCGNALSTTSSGCRVITKIR